MISIHDDQIADYFLEEVVSVFMKRNYRTGIREKDMNQLRRITIKGRIDPVKMNGIHKINHITDKQKLQKPIIIRGKYPEDIHMNENKNC